MTPADRTRYYVYLWTHTREKFLAGEHRHSPFSISPWPFPPCLKTWDSIPTERAETVVEKGSCYLVTLWKCSISWHIFVFITKANIANSTGTYCDLKSRTSLCLWICDIMLITPSSHKSAEKCLVCQKTSWTEQQQLL